MPISSLTPTSTPTETITPTATATFIFHPPTARQTSTKTPTPRPTKTRTPIPTATPITTVINDNLYEIGLDAWKGVDSNFTMGKGMRCSATKNETITFEISETTASLSLVFYKGPNQGKTAIVVDDILVETIDLYSKSPTYRFVWSYQISTLGETHKVKIRVLREKRFASAGYQVCSDGFKSDTVFTDDMNYAIRYGSWGGAWNGKALGGGYRMARLADSSVTFTTKGKSFQWITARGPNYGKAAIYVDSQLVKIVDLYLPVQAWRQNININGLSVGKHTVSIIVLGKSHPASTGTGIVIDGIIFP
jgi:hypothetical protein